MNGESAQAHNFAVRLPENLGVVLALTSTIALGLQIAGLYAAVATCGVWITVGLCAVGGLAAVLPYLVLRRATS